mgnify:CR=1 FL=1
MRTKKLFSLLLAVLMLCSLSVSAFAAETAQASVPVVLTVVNSVSPMRVYNLRGKGINPERYRFQQKQRICLKVISKGKTYPAQKNELNS